MRYIFHFIWKRRAVLLFLILQALNIFLIYHYNNFQYAQYFKLSESLNSYSQEAVTTVNSYLGLKEQNNILSSENATLRDTIAYYKALYKNPAINIYDSTVNFEQKFIQATVISSSLNKPNNHIIINKGSNDGLRIDMGVINGKGIIGQIIALAPDYALIMPLINTATSVSVKHKNSNQIGSVGWDGKTNNQIQVHNIPLHTQINIGDTILTSGFSAIYPKDLIIGYVDAIEKGQSFYTLDLKPGVDFNSIYNVYIFDNKEQTQIWGLIKKMDSIKK